MYVNVVSTFIHAWHPPLDDAVSNQDSSIALIARLVVDVFFFFVISKRGIGTVSVPVSVTVSLQAIQLFLQLPKPKRVFPGRASQIASLLHVQTHHSSRSMMPPLSSFNFFKGQRLLCKFATRFEWWKGKNYSDARRLVWNTNTSTANGFPASCYHHLNLAGQPMQPSLFPPKIKFNCTSGLV